MQMTSESRFCKLDKAHGWSNRRPLLQRNAIAVPRKNDSCSSDAHDDDALTDALEKLVIATSPSIQQQLQLPDSSALEKLQIATPTSIQQQLQTPDSSPPVRRLNRKKAVNVVIDSEDSDATLSDDEQQHHRNGDKQPATATVDLTIDDDTASEASDLEDATLCEDDVRSSPVSTPNRADAQQTSR